MLKEPITILTPTYNRKKFLPLMICNVEEFEEYDKSLINWLILDSYSTKGEEAEPLLNPSQLKELQKRLHPIKVEYHYLKKAMTIGEKRNWLSKNAKTKYLINMDSDDVYVPEYLHYSVNLLKKHKRECCGSPQMIFMYPKDEYKTTFISCPALRQIHEATMCYTKKHFKRMGGYQTHGFGEGAKMIDGCKEDIFVCSQVASCMLCICHDDNSVNKDKWNDDKKRIIIDMKIPKHMKIIQEIFNTKYTPIQSVNKESLPQ